MPASSISKTCVICFQEILNFLGTSHSDDLLYVVKYLPTSSEETESDSAMVKLMRSIFLSFIKTG